MKDDTSKPAAMQSGGFIKMMRTPDIFELLETAPLAFALAAVIALRARFRPGVSLKGLTQGEAFLGDHEKYGMTRQQYRTAIGFLKKHGFATIKSTTKGTRAKLMDTRLFNVLNESGQPTKQPTANHQPTTNEECKNGKNEKECLIDRAPLRSAPSCEADEDFPTADKIFTFAENHGIPDTTADRFLRYNAFDDRFARLANWRGALINFAAVLEGDPSIHRRMSTTAIAAAG
jgi:hypothetical protein